MAKSWDTWVDAEAPSAWLPVQEPPHFLGEVGLQPLGPLWGQSLVEGGTRERGQAASPQPLQPGRRSRVHQHNPPPRHHVLLFAIGRFQTHPPSPDRDTDFS